jgi:hypothetical protein
MKWETFSGNKLIDVFDPKPIADFQTLWDKAFHHKWQTISEKDLKLRQNYGFFKTIVNRVKTYNESYDITIAGVGSFSIHF